MPELVVRNLEVAANATIPQYKQLSNYKPIPKYDSASTDPAGIAGQIDVALISYRYDLVVRCNSSRDSAYGQSTTHIQSSKGCCAKSQVPVSIELHES